MKKAISFFIFSILLFVTALIIGNQAVRENALIAGGGVKSGEVLPSDAPTVVLPPEQLPQFQKISVYTPKKQDDSALFINPPDDNQKPTEESKSIQAGIM